MAEKRQIIQSWGDDRAGSDIDDSISAHSYYLGGNKI